MGLDMKTKRAVLKEPAPAYQRASKKRKGAMLAEFCALTGYHRGYASWLLRNCGRKVVWRGRDGERVILVGELRKVKRRRKPVYDEKVKEWLGWFWWLFNYPCGKPLVVMMREVCPKLEAMGRVKLPFRLKEKLWRVSASTADRLLQPERRKMALRSRARTKPGTLLKHQIPVRTFSDWDEQKPGFLEMDLVGHDGGVTRGDFCHSLNATDVATSWTEAEVVRNRAQVWVFEALQRIEKRLPFKLLGLDSDNDAAFINAHLIRYCQERHLSFTRGRAGRKNDSCYVEQKNYTAVRKLVGYLRYDTEEEMERIQRLYSWARLYYNFFRVTMKLREKSRIGSRVEKRYDEPKTPYQRVLESPYVAAEVKRKLRREYERLDIVEIKENIDRLQEKLYRVNLRKKKHQDFHVDSYVRQ